MGVLLGVVMRARHAIAYKIYVDRKKHTHTHLTFAFETNSTNGIFPLLPNILLKEFKLK